MGTWQMAGSKSNWSAQVAALKRGIELGLTLIDTAESYSGGRSEQMVAEAIRGRRDSIFLATKVSPSNLRYDDLIGACNRSLERLGTKQVDLYQVHWPNPSVPIGETMKAMEMLVREGKIRYIGISNFDVRETKAAQEALSKNELASNQVEYSATVRWAESSILPYCEREKVSLIAYSPLSRGGMPGDAVPQSIIQRYGMTPVQVILNWVTHREAVIGIPKAAQVEHVEENAKALEVRFAPEDYTLLSQSFA